MGRLDLERVPTGLMPEEPPVPMQLRDEQVLRLRQRAQHLDPRRSSDVADVVRKVVGLQAQDLGAATLGVRVRTSGLHASDVERARNEERSVVRTWCMRGTLHLVACDDVRWLVSLFGPEFNRGNRRRRADLGLDEEACARGLGLLREALAERGPMTRAEIVQHLARRGLSLEGQAVPHLIAFAAGEGVVCSGPDRGRDATYALLEDWVPQAENVPRDQALQMLARRYMAAYAPANPDDLAAWSGLPRSDIRAAWESIAPDLIKVSIGAGTGWVPQERAAWLDAPAESAPVVRLLPAFDTYLLGYRDRGLMLPPEHARRVNAGGGIVHPVVLVDGAAVGTWRSVRRRGGLEITVEPFRALAVDVEPGLGEEVSDVGRFTGLEAALRIASDQA